MMLGRDAVGRSDRIVGLDIDHGIDRLRRECRHHVVHVHADFLVVALLEAVLRGDGVDEDVADRRAGLVGDLLAAKLLDGGDAEVLAHHHLGGAADELDLGDGDEPALVGPMIIDWPA